MEQILILIAMFILSSLFKGKNKKEAPQKGQPKPFTAEPNNPVKKMKEMSRDMVKELQKELQNDAGEPPSRQTPPISTPRQPAIPELKPVLVEQTAAIGRESKRQSSEKHRGRLTVHGGVREVQTVADKHDFIPKTNEDFLKGIIFSEILAPPKSKR